MLERSEIESMRDEMSFLRSENFQLQQTVSRLSASRLISFNVFFLSFNFFLICPYYASDERRSRSTSVYVQYTFFAPSFFFHFKKKNEK